MCVYIYVCVGLLAAPLGATKGVLLPIIAVGSLPEWTITR